tara:strand:+ start:320 stop:931 length:612 start_codon:yes stop_codon:yes gene_type:complete
MDTVLHIPELVRDIVSHGSTSVMIFFANKKTLEQESCAAVYRTWAREGCPSGHVCLPGIGGIESMFCVGRFIVTVGHEYLFYVEKTRAQICSRLKTYITMHKDELGTLHMTFDSGGTKVRLFSLATDHFKAVISYSGWQKIEDSVIITKEKTISLVQEIVKTTGDVKINDELSFKIARRLSLSVCLVDESETQWNMLQVYRSA